MTPAKKPTTKARKTVEGYVAALPADQKLVKNQIVTPYPSSALEMYRRDRKIRREPRMGRHGQFR